MDYTLFSSYWLKPCNFIAATLISIDIIMFLNVEQGFSVGMPLADEL